jgi:hypothetical protein
LHEKQELNAVPRKETKKNWIPSLFFAQFLLEGDSKPLRVGPIRSRMARLERSSVGQHSIQTKAFRSSSRCHVVFSSSELFLSKTSHSRYKDSRKCTRKGPSSHCSRSSRASKRNRTSPSSSPPETIPSKRQNKKSFFLAFIFWLVLKILLGKTEEDVSIDYLIAVVATELKLNQSIVTNDFRVFQTEKVKTLAQLRTLREHQAHWESLNLPKMEKIVLERILKNNERWLPAWTGALVLNKWTVMLGVAGIAVLLPLLFGWNTSTTSHMSLHMKKWFSVWLPETLSSFF